jgi:hypothetical protein
MTKMDTFFVLWICYNFEENNKEKAFNFYKLSQQVERQQYNYLGRYILTVVVCLFIINIVTLYPLDD